MSKKRKLLIAGVIGGVLVITAITFLCYHPAILHLLTGSGRVLSPPVDAAVYVGGKQIENAGCFQMTSTFAGEPVDRLVIVIPSSPDLENGMVLIVDKSSKKAGYSNYVMAGNNILFGHYLIQQDGADLFLDFNDSKYQTPNFNPEMQITQDSIRFFIPEKEEDNKTEIKLIF